MGTAAPETSTLNTNSRRTADNEKAVVTNTFSI
jgi:hypothetical protein